MNDFNQAETRTAYLDLYNAKGLHLEDLTKTQINRVYLYAKKNEQEGITWANFQAAHDEQKRSFEYWLEMYLNYWQAQKVIKIIEQHINKTTLLQYEIAPEHSNIEPIVTPQQSKKAKAKLTIKQIALKFAYEDQQITRKNSEDIVKQYGHNSGDKLYNEFTYFSSRANRKGKPNICTPKKLKNKIELIESVIELLPTNKQGLAKDEVSILKKIYETEYQ